MVGAKNAPQGGQKVSGVGGNGFLGPPEPYPDVKNPIRAFFDRTRPHPPAGLGYDWIGLDRVG